MTAAAFRHLGALARAFALALWFVALCSPAGAAGGRVALLVGVGAYDGAGLALRNPPNDAAALGATLRGLGFDVTVLTDVDRRAALAGLDRFAAAAEGAEMALFFFAGHGVQIDGENYLLMRDFAASASEPLAAAAVTLGEATERLVRAKPAIGFVFLDACRDNPFAGTIAARPGLARARGGAGILFGYATDPDRVAYDGAGANSVFTAALIEHIGAPGVEARLMFGRVRQQVALESHGLQVPWVEEAVFGEHYFNGAAPPGAPAGHDSEIAAWRAAQTAGAQGLRDYLTAYPGGLFAVFARDELARPASAERVDVGALVAGADRAQLASALDALGYLSATRGQPPAEPELAAAVEGWAQASAGAGGLEGLYLDAAQVTVMLGAATAQRIRADMAALAAVERTRAMAGRARGELAALAASAPQAAAALAQADADLAAIDAARARVLDRLDDNRERYADLVRRGETDLRPWLARALPGLVERARGLPDVERRLSDDAGTFIRHAEEASARPEGSYAWLADFLPRD